MSESSETVSKKQCISTIIFCAIASLVAFLPYTLSPYRPAIEGMTSGYFFSLIPEAIGSLEQLFPIPPELLSMLQGFSVSFMPTYFSILAMDIVAALLLLIFRSNILRVIFKIMSVVLAFYMIVVSLMALLSIIGSVFYFMGIVPPNDPAFVMLIVSSNLPFLGIYLFSTILIRKQFKWFSKSKD
ncbi:MAG: hypothetical protein E7369_04195 [Clostridiales bacterium]|nr:hypothetical protein [Clostridiales bacterium]